TDRRRVTAATGAIAGITLVDLLAAAALRVRRKSEAKGGSSDGLRVRKSITVRRSPEEVYGFWRDFANLPRFMAHLESVEVIDERRSQWKVRAPIRGSVEWTAELTEDRPGELIAWRSLAGADVANAGRVQFELAPRNEGTEVRVEMEYAPPAGALAAVVARLAQEEPSQQVAGDLRRFKQVIETGEVVRSEATAGDGGIKQRPAQPPADGEIGGRR
ncbi:MAG TPA: SRPBCC family protein, partial [Candidatus Caenarcaniphilales bacterium]|nr:SRPBCC family protein [Candidatus Caenarcaniphilales bacterium]